MSSSVYVNETTSDSSSSSVSYNYDALKTSSGSVSRVIVYKGTTLADSDCKILQLSNGTNLIHKTTTTVTTTTHTPWYYTAYSTSISVSLSIHSTISVNTWTHCGTRYTTKSCTTPYVTCTYSWSGDNSVSSVSAPIGCDIKIGTSGSYISNSSQTTKSYTWSGQSQNVSTTLSSQTGTGDNAWYWCWTGYFCGGSVTAYTNNGGSCTMSNGSWGGNTGNVWSPWSVNVTISRIYSGTYSWNSGNWAGSSWTSSSTSSTQNY